PRLTAVLTFRREPSQKRWFERDFSAEQGREALISFYPLPVASGKTKDGQASPHAAVRAAPPFRGLARNLSEANAFRRGHPVA
ncbi:MAG: hypothetical protein ACM3U2_10565, partial [Deltaproteobacteria bacterium]